MEEKINKSRRRFLVGSTTALGVVGGVGVAVPFLCSWQPSDAARASGAPVQVDVSKLEEGQQMTIAWQGKPVWIVRRTAQTIKDLPKLNAQLVDPFSSVDQQPAYADNLYRSIKPEYLVLVGICTHLGCSPTYQPTSASDDDAKWYGGYVCPCHGSRFDLAGRVYKHYPAPTNLVVPPYHFKNNRVIVIGIGQNAEGDV
ncbi:Ubiquinol-cytochrome c reductase iron-sulfur subunit [Marinomonas spartinae]|uniref:ubiquinol-cytochrome c reductase iron-sulfur subunit n=1 Tax=Marinomonas spartinae TaxID=1792290 RepID=UPI000808F745|nr:ubiquinol-cytochrome c reductase iron-sulfur subunit [Marinomonas spartinae]SBS37134.1 Ubiquinol-cytochrome c reductase iron-sulfur subunit [Marinomonas spartinae]